MQAYRKQATTCLPKAILVLVLLGGSCLAGLCACQRQMTNGGATVPARAATIQNKGSDTMVNLALAWVEAYAKARPDVHIAVTGGGSGTGIAALINGTVDLANASRRIKDEERAEAEANGVAPVEHTVAGDAIAVLVHPSNLIGGLTIAELSAVFSGKITNWSELGGADRPIVLVSRESNSGTHVFFLETIVRQGNSEDKTLFSPDTLLMPSSEGISAEVRQNPNAIGYDGLGYVTPDQKVLGVARTSGKPYVLPSVASVQDGSYPIARGLYMYTVGEPQGEVRAYLDWIMGPAGQTIVKELGFVPLQ